MYFVKIQIDKCSDIYNLELLMVRTFVSIGACIVLSDEFERMEYLGWMQDFKFGGLEISEKKKKFRIRIQFFEIVFERLEYPHFPELEHPHFLELE
nr:hypothetical protein CFP56_68559 [Quercus suber]